MLWMGHILSVRGGSSEKLHPIVVFGYLTSIDRIIYVSQMGFIIYYIGVLD